MPRRIVPPLLLGAVLAPACLTRRPPPPGASGELIYDLQNCANCHGGEREGTRLGPPLERLAERWTCAALADYLADPRPVVARDPRLTALDREYSGKMDRYDNLDLGQRLVLADWLLSR